MTTILVLDTETTGLDPDADVIELGSCAVTLQNGEDGDHWRGVSVTSQRFRTDKFIPPQVRAIHHITRADVADRLTFAEFGRSRLDNLRFFEADAVCFHNADFDWPLIERHLLKEDRRPPQICTRKCAIRAWPAAPSWSNQALRYHLTDLGLWPFGFSDATAMPPHAAGPDAYVTANLLLVLLSQVPLETLLRWSAEPRYMPTCPIGEFKGRPWADVRLDFLDWMIHKAKDLDRDTRAAAQAEKDRRIKEREEKLP